MKYKYKVGDKVNNKGKNSAIVIDGVVKSLSDGNIINRLQPCKPGPYYFIEDKTGYLIGVLEEDIDLTE